MLKVGLSTFKKVCFISFNQSLVKVVKNAFYLVLKALFVPRIFKFLIFRYISGHARKRLDWKAKVNFKIYDVTTSEANNYNTHIAQISQEVKTIRQWNFVS